MDFELRQRGRATIDFLADLAAWAGSKAPAINSELATRGLDAEHLDADLDVRLDQVEAGIADSGPFFAWSQIGEWLSERHGDAAIAAFEEIRADLVPDLEQLQRGPATLDRQIGDDVPDYFRGVEFHRTRGGWDGHPYQGFIHGELIHKKYVAKNYPGDIFGQRRQILAELPRQDYRRIFEMGSSSGHFTIPLQETFPNAQLTGCDLSAIMLEHAQRVANERGWAWRLLQVPAEDTGLPGESFDLVASFILLHELPAAAIRAVFREAFRLLEPGGDMIMSDVRPFRDMDRLTEWRAYYLAVHGGEPHWRDAATIDLAAAAAEAGFTDARSYGLEPMRYPWVTVAHKPG